MRFEKLLHSIRIGGAALHKRFRRLTIQQRDWLRFSPWARWFTSFAINALCRIREPRTVGECARQTGVLCRAARICPSEGLLRRIEGLLLARLSKLDTSQLNWDESFPAASDNNVRKAIILKRPNPPHERGVLFVAFEDQWLRILRYGNLERLARDYHLVLAPTWSPPHDVPFLLATRMWRSPFFHILSNLDDCGAFARLSRNAIPVPLISSHWVHPSIFEPRRTVEREYDIVVLANFSSYKRHFVLFSALARMPKATRVLLLGKSWEGRTADTLREEARLWGVENLVTIREGLPDTQMIEAMQSAKVGAIFSANEGACVAVAELMFADVPVALLANANVGSRAFIGPDTGVFLRRSHVAADLSAFVRRHRDFASRNAMLAKGVSCFESTRILNAAIMRKALEWKEPWTADIVAHTWRPNPTYVCVEDRERMHDAYHEFPDKYGVTLQLAKCIENPSGSACRA